MSLLEHLRSSPRPTTPARSRPAPPPEPTVVATPPPATEAAPRLRSAVRNEAHLELKMRVHEELIHELDPNQLVGDLSFTSPARRAVEQAAEERIRLADPAVGRQGRLRLAAEIPDAVRGHGPPARALHERT